MTARDAIAAECDAIKAMLLAKNDAYGNSALEPVRVFSSASAEEQLRVRIDDKLSRIVRGHAAGEDAVLDLIGYLVLLRVASRSVTPLKWVCVKCQASSVGVFGPDRLCPACSND